jgi:hypothetical protein
MIRLLSRLASIAILALATTCGGHDKLEACTRCVCNCADSIMEVSSTPPPCDCQVTCASACGRTPVSAQCSGPIEVDSCAASAR